jgi:hypothetical protein
MPDVGLGNHLFQAIFQLGRIEGFVIEANGHISEAQFCTIMLDSTTGIFDVTLQPRNFFLQLGAGFFGRFDVSAERTVGFPVKNFGMPFGAM